MIIKEAVFAKKRKTVNVRVSEEIYGCDCCKKKIDPDSESLLRIQVFQKDADGNTLPCTQKEFCSWKCVLRFLPKVKSNYFVGLPYLSYDEMPAGSRAQDFLNLIKPRR